jgi:predicted PurR-regulated permease PerM
VQPPPSHNHRLFIERVLIVLAIGGLALLLWALRGLAILVFGAVLVAVILRVIANPIRRRLHLPDGVALLIAVLIVAGLVGAAFTIFGAEVARQASSLRESIPEAWAAVQARLEAVGLAEPAREWVEMIRAGSGGVVSNFGSIAMSVGSAVADTVLVIVGGIFFAAEPRLYRVGIVKLVPEEARPNVAQALEDSWRALRLWLLGRLASMTIVGILTGLGLWLIGIPAALTLGITAGLLDFVPFVGPIVAAVPAVLLALASDPTSALWVIGLYLLIQQIEGNIVTPLVQKRAVELPPALLLFSLVAAGLVFGIVGILFAEPLTVVAYVLVKRLYVREALDTPTSIPGEKKD